MRNLRIFIGSPGDVEEERELAKQVIEGLRRRYAKRFYLKPVLWEELPLQADTPFMDGIDMALSEEHGLDVAVFILWARMGSRQPGSKHRSGTEREFEIMREARKKSGGARPSLLVYTRQDEPSFNERLRGKSTREQQEMIGQKALVEDFIQEYFEDTTSGHNRGAFHRYVQPGVFAKLLREHLIKLLDALAGGGITEAGWDIPGRAPFMGLEAYNPADAAIFFGREDECVEARHTLRRHAREGCAFLLLSGASGSGKSSLARAGVLPAIVEHELDEHVSSWRTIIVTPSELAPNPLLALARLLGSHSVLPNLYREPGADESIAQSLRLDPKGFIEMRLRNDLADAAEGAQGGVRLLLVLDQLEELFASSTISAENRAAFLVAVEAMARSGHVWVIATMRSDFYQHLQSEGALVSMKQGGGQLDVLPPGTGDLRSIVEEPARLAGLTFEQRDGVSLASVILRDAATHTELLPLVEFLLRELYEARTEGQLTFAAYEKLGGVEGALAKRAEEAFQSLPDDAKEMLGRVLQALVTLGSEADAVVAGEAAGGERLVCQRVRLSMFGQQDLALTLINTFIKERLFTASRHGGLGEASVMVAHESLLRAWPRAEAWAENNRDFLRTRARVAMRLKDGSPISEGDPLLDAAETHLALQPEGFNGAQRRFIENCVSAAGIRARRAVGRRRMAFSTMACLLVLALMAATLAIRETRRTKQLLADVEEEKAKQARVGIDFDHLEKGRSLLKKARISKSDHDHLTAMMLAGAAVGFHQYGRQVPDEPWIEQDFPSLLGQPMQSDFHEGSRLREIPGVRELMDSCRPSLLPIWSTPIGSNHAAPISCVAFSPDGTRLASCTADGWGNPGTIILWDVATGRRLATLSGHSFYVLCVAFSPDGTLLASGSGDNTMKLWDTTTGRELLTFHGHTKPVRSVAYSPDGRWIASAAEDHTVKLWNPGTGRELVTLGGGAPSSSVNSVSFSPDGSRLAGGASDGSIKLWDTSSWEQLPPLTGHRSAVTGVAFSPSGLHLASGSQDGTVKIWDSATGRNRATSTGRGSAVTSVAFSPDGVRVASGSFDGSAKLWSATVDAPLASVLGYTTAVTSVAFSPDGARLATSSQDGSVKIWDAGMHAALVTLAGHSSNIASVCFSQDGRCLASASEYSDDAPTETQVIKLWDTATGQELQSFTGRGSNPRKLYFTPDCRHLVLLCPDGTSAWDLATGQPAPTPAFSPDSAAKVSTQESSPDGRLWARAAGNLIHVFAVPDPARSRNSGGQGAEKGSLQPDLLHFQRQGLFKVSDDRVFWAKNFEVQRSREFTPLHYYHDEVAALATPGLSPTETLLLRLRLCGRTGQWRAARALWRQISKSAPGVAADRSVTQAYLLQLLVAARTAMRSKPGLSDVPTDLVRDIPTLLTRELNADVQVSSVLASVLPDLAIRPSMATDAEFDSLVHKVAQTATLPWIEGVAENARRLCTAPHSSEAARARFVQLIQSFNEVHTESVPLTRCFVATLSPDSPQWLSVVRRLLAMPLVQPDDFAHMTYLAAQQPGMAATARELLQESIGRFPSSSKVLRYAGWSWIHLSDPATARDAFERASSLLKEEDAEAPATFAGLAVAQWLSSKREDAIATYVKCIQVGRKTYDWTDPGKIDALDWPDLEKKHLEAVRSAALAKHPDLGFSPATGIRKLSPQ